MRFFTLFLSLALISSQATASTQYLADVAKTAAQAAKNAMNAEKGDCADAISTVQGWQFYTPCTDPDGWAVSYQFHLNDIMFPDQSAGNSDKTQGDIDWADGNSAYNLADWSNAEREYDEAYDHYVDAKDHYSDCDDEEASAKTSLDWNCGPVAMITPVMTTVLV